VTFQEAVILAETEFGTLGAHRLVHAASLPRPVQGRRRRPSPTYSYTACVVEVDVDPTTGWIHVPKVWIAHDIGRAMNPVLAEARSKAPFYMGSAKR
jgi:CO/xanthine dehydrogenase Mo-binding subunit